MDDEIRKILNSEIIRQKKNIELIASENYVSDVIRELQGSVFTNKYAEGYPHSRYYGGCENMDDIEELAIKYARKLFNVKYVNVQPHSGSGANIAVFNALLDYGDKIMGMDLSCGGHLTHGYKLSFSGKNYKVISYGVDGDGYLDYDSIRLQAIKEKPKLIIAGGSAYSRRIDFKKFKEIALECGAHLMVDMAHIAGLVATGLHMSPMQYADVITSTTHKTLRGPRGGLIMTNDLDIAKKIDRAVFPLMQGGPLMHVIAAKAQCFYEALQDSFNNYQNNVVNNAKVLSSILKDNGFKIVSGGTDNHLLVIDVKSSLGMTGDVASSLLEKINITVNKNSIPYDLEKANITSGIRLGTAAMTTLGYGEEDFRKIGIIISKCLRNYKDDEMLSKLKEEVLKMVGDRNG